MVRTVEDHPDATPDRPVSRLRIKAIPGARRAGIASVVGDLLKVKVSAPPEGGKANLAICRLIASELGLKPAQISIEAGLTDHEKTLRVEGLSGPEIERRLGL